MPFRGHNRILESLEPFISQLKAPHYMTSFSQCFVVFVHYRWGATLFSVMLVASLSGWFAQENAICVSKFDRSEISPEMQDICITYPYSEQVDANGVSYRAYALHYKWIPYSFGLILAFFVGLQLLVQKMEDKKVKSMLDNVLHLGTDVERYAACENYFLDNVGRHVHLASTRTQVLLACLATNCIVFFVLNMTIAGFYLHLPLYLFSIREMENFSDPMSVAFPPFIECELAPNMQLWMDRTERIGCYLPLMELYEKMFIGIWLWQHWVFFMSLIALALDQAPKLIPRIRRTLLMVADRPQISARVIISRTSLGDVLLLKKVRPLLTADDFQTLIESVADVVRNVHGEDQSVF